MAPYFGQRLCLAVRWGKDIIVPGFETIIGQQQPVRILQTLLRSATLPHAMLFTGPAGVGKRMAARIVAMALNCRDRRSLQGDPCGECPACRQIHGGKHPDIPLIEPQTNLLRIDQIRELLATLSMKPFSARHRVVIIAEAHCMNPEAANALLKMLEEPPARTMLILTALQKSDLLPTIVSRCRHIRFKPLSPRNLITLLKQAPDIDAGYAPTAAALAGGSLSRAMQLSLPEWQQRRNWVIRAAGLDRPEPRTDASAVALALAFAGQLAQKKDMVRDLLDILKTWIRDLSIWPYHPELVINSDHKGTLSKVRAGISEKQLLAMWQAVEKAQKDIAARANLRLTMDAMALGMAGFTPTSYKKDCEKLEIYSRKV
jgi:DNA polymerase III subunit delta'